MKKLQLTISLLLLCILTSLGVRAGELSKKINLVFIGNSITHAYYLNEANRPPSAAAFMLGETGLNIKFSNCGVSGSTTVDFLPSRNNLFKNVVNEANSLNESDAQLVFSIMLGTNDSAIKGPTGAPVSPKKYKENLQCIIDSLKLRYPDCKVVLNRPLWYSPNTHNSSEYLQEGLDRLQTYFPQIQDLVKENDFVYEGDTDAFEFFKTNYLQYLKPEQGNSGTFYLHPNQAGAEKLAGFWAKALKKNLIAWGYDLNAKKTKVACVGNSITENTALAEDDKYPSILNRNLGDDYTVRNFGASGHTLLKKGDVPYWNSYKYTEALNWNPDIVIIKLGTNDVKTQNWDKYKGEFKQDYIDFINSFKKSGNNPKFYVCYPLPLFGGANNWLRSNGDKIITNEMMPIIAEIAQETGATIVDLHSPFIGHDNFVYDQVHPNVQGTTYLAYILGSAMCPECNISFPENIFIRFSQFDYTKAVEELSSTLDQETNLSRLIDANVETSIDVPYIPKTSFTLKISTSIKTTGYALTVKNKDQENNPVSWTLEGSTDGKRWRILDTRKEQIFLPADTKIIDIAQSGVSSYFFNYFRLTINSNNGGSKLHLADWQVFGYDNQYKESLTSNGGTTTGQYAGVNQGGWVETIDKVTDGKFDTKYCVLGQVGGWIQYESSVAAKITKYSITSSEKSLADRDPKSWQLLGSNNGTTWHTLDTRKDQDFMAGNSTQEYTISDPKEYKIYRLNITDNKGQGKDFQLSEWMLFEEKGSSITVNTLDSRVYSGNGKIYLNTNSSDTKYELFNISGNKIIEGSTANGEAILSAPFDGIFFLKLNSLKGNKTEKLILKN